MNRKFEKRIDEPFLKSFDSKLQLIKDRVSSVVNHYHTGAYLVGPPGTSKTFTVQEQLEKSDVPWIFRNSRMTPMGLFSFIADHPEHVIVLDDIVTLFKNDQAMQILMAALDGAPGSQRIVTYKSKDEDLKVPFFGGIISISNLPLRNDPLARALGSRVVTLEHEPSDQEIAAHIRRLAKKGFDGLVVEECFQVSEFLISETRNSDLPLDLRHYTKALQDYRQWKDGLAVTSWKDLIRTSLKRIATEQILPISKGDDIALQREKVRKSLQEFPNDSKAQIEATGLSKSTFYARRREVLSEDAA